MGFVFELLSEIAVNLIEDWDKMKNRIRIPIFMVAILSLLVAIVFYEK